MVAMDVQMDDRSTKLLTDMARKFPREVRRAFYYACGITLKIMRGRMSGKNEHIEKWADFTTEWRKRADNGAKFGGKLMSNRGKLLTMQPEGDRCRIGWIGALEDAAKRFQRGGSEPTKPEWRQALYKYHGYKPGEVPRVAVTPQRPVIEQAKDDTARHMTEWTLGALDKCLRRSLKYWETRYHKTAGTRQGVRAASRAADATIAARRVAAYMSDPWTVDA